MIKKTNYICVQMSAWTPHIWSYVSPFCLWSLTRCFAAKRLPSSTHRLARSFLPLHSASLLHPSSSDPPPPNPLHRVTLAAHHTPHIICSFRHEAKLQKRKASIYPHPPVHADLIPLQRRSDGPKLGQIVAKDLRKQTKHGLTSPVILELDGKNLTDDGCLAMVNGLEETLRTHDGQSANRLEELHLTGNQLTTTSLRALAPIIDLARFDLADLDLSGNNISVKTENEARDWEIFLKAFCGCRVLRRIDLSRNSLDGPRAFEIFERVYSQQPPVDPTQLERNGSESGTESAGDLAELTNRTRNLSITSPTDDPSIFSDAMSAGTVLKRREGLRAIPYIILNDTGMTDAGALYFSYALQKHYFPQQLMCPLRPGPQATQLDEYRQSNHCWGLIYLPNNGLTDTGRRLLEKAEDSRSEFTGIEEDMAELSDSVGSFVVVAAKQANSAVR